ncbi:MAG TPA: hypothetical protein VN207_10465 [Ktedonobacteraceae bacterium]|nr:hypothetical protein [Ktedonobacteraceae bacterium]
MPNSSKKVPLSQAPTTLPKLKASRSEAQQKLQTQIDRGRAIAQRVITSDAEMDTAYADRDKWREYAITLLLTLFDDSTFATDYEKKTQFSSIRGHLPFEREQEAFKDWLNNCWIMDLESICERLDLIEESPSVNQANFSNNMGGKKNPQEAALEKIELIANRFRIVARQLRQRHCDHKAPRHTLEIRDEYDVQDLFHALLRLFFDDVRDEEWTPSYAGNASRIDFLLKQEQILVEIKMTRPGLTKGKDVSDQLIIDSERYRVHPDCKMLVAFVYDPQEYLNNPSGIERDLTKTINDVPVKVIIR